MLRWKDIVHFSLNGSPQPDERVVKEDAEWQSILTPEQFRITRNKGTEVPHTGELCGIYEPGKYVCSCCSSPLFDSTIKFDSGTGWPSFSQPVKENAVKYMKDASYGMVRIEAQCNCCDAHLGHVFPDGPEPSGLRYCINSVAIKLEQKDHA